MGIISSEAIFATNIKFLNDEHEFQHALNLIKEIIPTSKITPEHRDHDTYRKFIEELEEKLKTLDDYESESIFTVSFSEETDLLSQWRGYCPENNGLCIVFDLNKIYQQVNLIHENAYLVKCVYDTSSKETQIKDLLNKSWSKYLAETKQKERKEIVNLLAKEIILLASYFKHSSFSEEKEQRIVVILDYAPDNDLKFRSGHSSIIPYIELPASRRSINSICIGPSSNKQLSKRALEMFWEKTYGVPMAFSKLEVAFSTTPYRPW